MNTVYKATIKATGEELHVYMMSNANYYDYDNMGVGNPPTAPIAGKKEFKPEELSNLIEIKLS